MFRSAILFLLALSALLFAAPLLAVQVQLVPAADSTLYEDPEGDVANGSGRYLFMGQTGPDGNSELRRSLVRFDLTPGASTIPAGAKVTAVTLQFEIDQVPSGDAMGGTATLHRVNASWGEGISNPPGNEGQGTIAVIGDATWQHRFYNTMAWTQAGGDFNGTASASVGYGVSLGPLTFTSAPGLVADVQAWIADPASNQGWILIGEEGTDFTARKMFSRDDEGIYAPLLTVDYFIPSVTDNLELNEIASSLDKPVAIANAADSTNRLFILERPGRIRIFDTATQTLLPTPYLDITSLVDSTGTEQGLLGLAFHPDFTSNRKFYVYYTRDPAGVNLDRSVVAMYTQSVGDANIADTTPTVVLEFEQYSSNHNGGDLHFGEDGYLYIASGDGGGGGDPDNNAQNSNNLLGKILRIDVDGSPGGSELCGLVKNYGATPGTAFPGGSDGCDEILHLGLRNPWRFSFDAQTEELYIGDVGQGDWEEIDHAAPGASGINFGWSCKEGTHVYNAGRVCPNAVDPIIEYSSGSGTGECAVTGGYVYRGSGTALFGYYVFGDYCSERIWLARPEGGGWITEEWEEASAILSNGSLWGLSAFGQDERCELYAADVESGKLYRIDDTQQISRRGFEKLRCQ